MIVKLDTVNLEFYLQFNSCGSKYIATHYSTEIETKIKEFHKIIESEVKAQATQYYLLKSLSYSIFNEVIYFPKFEISQCEPDFISNFKNMLTN